MQGVCAGAGAFRPFRDGGIAGQGHDFRSVSADDAGGLFLQLPRQPRAQGKSPYGHRIQHPGDIQPVGFPHRRLHGGSLFARHGAQVDQQGACSAAEHVRRFFRVVEHGGDGAYGQQEIGRQGLDDGIGQGENQRGRFPDFFQIGGNGLNKVCR